MKKLITLLILVLFCVSACSEDNRAVDNSLVTDIAGREYTMAVASVGEGDSYFEGYDVYFDEGISIKYAEIAETSDNGWKGYNFTRTGCVENILFNNKYTDTFFGGVGVGAAKADVVKDMGAPDFEDELLQVFGYKTDDIYIFFVGDEMVREISVYPIHKNYDTAVIDEIIALCNEGEYSRALACQAAEILEQNWTDYNYSYNIPDNARYSPRSKGVGIAYYDRGIQLCYSDENTAAPLLKIYGNYSGDVSSVVNDDVIEYAKDADFVFEQEKQRLKQADELNQKIEKGSKSPDGSIVLVDNSTSTGIDVIHINKDKPDYCIMTSPLQYGAAEWINDRYIIFEYGKTGVRIYDMEKNRYIEGGNCSEIEVMPDTIRLINSVGEVISVSYYFDESGDIVLNSKTEGVSAEWIDGKLASGYTPS